MRVVAERVATSRGASDCCQQCYVLRYIHSLCTGMCSIMYCYVQHCVLVISSRQYKLLQMDYSFHEQGCPSLHSKEKNMSERLSL